MKDFITLWIMPYYTVWMIEKLFFWYKTSDTDLMLFLLLNQGHPTSTWRFWWSIEIWIIIRLDQNQKKCKSKGRRFLDDLQLTTRIKNKVRLFEEFFVRLYENSFKIFRILLCLPEFCKHLVSQLLIFVLQFETLVNAQLWDSHDFCWIAEVFKQKNTVHSMHNLESCTPHATFHCVEKINDCRKKYHVANLIWHEQSDRKILLAIKLEFFGHFVEMYKMKDLDLFRQQVNLYQLKEMLPFKVKLFCDLNVYIENP